MPSLLNIVQALKAEAQPLIEYFGLKLSSEHLDYSVYVNEYINLIISGMGKASAKNATEYLANSQQTSGHRAWLNVGIAGHPSLPIGAGVLANKILNQATGETWYPAPLTNSKWERCQIITVEEVEKCYREEACYDMEAAGFFPTACHNSLVDMVSCYKIISDNKKQSIQQVTRPFVVEIIRSQLPNIEALMNQLLERVQLVSARWLETDSTNVFFGKWSFTVTQQFTMMKLLSKCAGLGYQITSDSEEIRSCSDSRAVIQVIQQTLDSHWKQF